MSTTNLRARLRSVFCWAVILWSPILFAAVSPSPTDFEELWLGNPVITESEKLSFTLHYPESAGIGETIPLALELLTTTPYQETKIRLTVEGTNGDVLEESEITVNLRRGRNDLTINWTPKELPPGKHALLVAVDYTNELSPVSHLIPLNRVSSSHWQKELEELKPVLAQLEESISSLVSEAQGTEQNAQAINTPPNSTSLQVRGEMAGAALEEAERAFADNHWRLVDRHLTYAKEALNIIRAEITFINILPETLLAHTPYPERVSIHDGGMFDKDRPLFLIGAALKGDTSKTTQEASGDSQCLAYAGADTLAEQVAWLKTHGMNFAVMTLPMNMDPESLQEMTASLSRSAGEFKIPWLLQVDQSSIAGSLMDKWPELLEPGFVNLAHEEFSTYYRQTINDVIGLAGAQSYPPVGASLAWGPQFKYDGDPIRERFIAVVRERYPDRIDLNRLWRSHLADHNEITIWGDYPDHSYQNQRTYQYEWQTFHRSLITHFFASIKQDLAALAPNVPAMITLPESPFLPGETRNSPSREDMAGMMDINGCFIRFEAGEGMYALNYPYPHATIALLRSYAPDKPVLILNGDINVAPLADAGQREKVVHSAVWEAVMAGATGLALSTESSLFQYPEAMAAYSLAAMDVNRLAPIILAFQQAPAEIAVLFSEASKIMDDGVLHLESAQYAFEGASFGGFPVRFLTEQQIKKGELEGIKVLILATTMAVPDDTFEYLSGYVEDGGMVARVGTPIPYNEKGHSRTDVIRATANTILVRGMNLPTEYLHALDAALVGGVLPETARPVNAHGYPLEGVRSRCVRHDGESYLYIINLCQEPVAVHLSGLATQGYDLIRGRDVQFPRVLPPLDPMLIRLKKSETVFTVAN